MSALNRFCAISRTTRLIENKDSTAVAGMHVELYFNNVWLLPGTVACGWATLWPSGTSVFLEELLFPADIDEAFWIRMSALTKLWLISHHSEGVFVVLYHHIFEESSSLNGPYRDRKFAAVFFFIFKLGAKFIRTHGKNTMTPTLTVLTLLTLFFLFFFSFPFLLFSFFWLLVYM